MKKGMRRWIALLLAAAMLFACTVTALAANGLTAATVTLRIEYAEQSETVPVELTVTHRDFSEYGLTDLTDPGYVTPIHVLAEYFVQERQVAVAEVKNYIGISGTYLSTIDGSSGSKQGQGETSWMFAVNDLTPVKPENPSVGYMMADYPVAANDEITFYGVWWGDYMEAVDAYYTYFDQKAYQGVTGEPVEVSLRGRGIYDFSTANQAIGGAEILADQQNAQGDKTATTQTGFVTGEDGKAQLIFQEAGTYVISAQRKNGDYDKWDISRPFAVVTVTASNPTTDEETVDADLEALTLPERVTANLTLPQIGDSGKTVITWTSDKPGVIAADGKVVRPGVGEANETVTLTATLQKATISKEKRLEVVVPAMTEAEREADIQAIKDALKSGSSSYVKVVEGKDTNIVTVLQALADAAVPGSTISLVSASAHSQIDASGSIAYGDSRVKAAITVAIAYGGTSVQHEVTVQVPAHILTAQEEVQADADALTFAQLANGNEAIDKVTQSLRLPTMGSEWYSDIAWSSDNEAVISKYGTVKRPAYGEPNAQVKLTATITLASWSSAAGTATPVTKDFDVTVLAYSEQEYNEAKTKVENSLTALENYEFTYIDAEEPVDPGAVKFDLRLTSNAEAGVDVAWSSNDSAVAVNYLRGKVSRPGIGEQARPVTLTVTASMAGYADTREFQLTVAPLTQAEVEQEAEDLRRVYDALGFDTIKKENANADFVSTNLRMVYGGTPSDGEVAWSTNSNNKDTAKITWETSNADYLASYGTVVARPPLGSPDQQVTLKAKIASQLYSEADVTPLTKEIMVTIPAYTNELKRLTVGDAEAALNGETGAYELLLDSDAEVAALQVEPKDPQSPVTVEQNGTPVAQDGGSYPIALTEQLTTVTVKIGTASLAAAANEQSYTLNIRRKAAPLPDYEAQWNGFRGNAANMAITSAKTARTGDEAYLKWQSKLATGWFSAVGAPIIVDDYIFIASGSTLKKLDKAGNVVATASMASSSGFFSFPVYGDGMLFMPVSQGRIQAFNAETLEPLWISEERSGQQSLCPLVYHDGYVYTGSANADVLNSVDGTYFCLDVRDEDPGRSDEVKAATWEYRIPSGRKGFYWSGGVVVGDSILFGGDNGQLVSHSLTEDRINGTFQAQGDIGCSIAYDAQSGRVYFTTRSGYLYSVGVNADGTLQDGSAVEVKLGNGAESTSTPVVYNGRVYVGTGSMTSAADGSIAVLNAEDLSLIYEVPTGDGLIQASGLLTKGYGDTVYVYFTSNSPDSEVFVLEDYPGNKTAKLSTLFIPEEKNYTTSSLIADAEGTLYYTNDSGNLFAIGNKPIRVEEVTLNRTELALAVGERATLTATITPQNAPNKTVVWASSDPAVATVENGVVRALAAGRTTVTATVDGVSVSCVVTVKTAGEPTAQPTTSPERNEETTPVPTVTPNNTATPTASPEGEEDRTPATGDGEAIWVWLALALIAGGSLVVLTNRKQNA